MIKVILIDDEPLARSIVREYLQAYPQLQIVEECDNGFEGFKAIQQHQPDLIFLDIQMPKITGFEMLELLENPPSVIFTTAFDEYAIQAFETHAVDYLLKPFSQMRFDKALKKWEAQQKTKEVSENNQSLVETVMSEQSQERIIVKNGTQIKIIPTATIHYLEAADDFVKIHTAEGAFLKNKTLSFFEKSLNENHFVRCHRSFLINIQEITKIHPYEKDSQVAILKSGQQIPISKSGYAKLKQVLGL